MIDAVNARIQAQENLNVMLQTEDISRQISRIDDAIAEAVSKGMFQISIVQALNLRLPTEVQMLAIQNYYSQTPLNFVVEDSRIKW